MLDVRLGFVGGPVVAHNSRSLGRPALSLSEDRSLALLEVPGVRLARRHAALEECVDLLETETGCTCQLSQFRGRLTHLGQEEVDEGGRQEVGAGEDEPIQRSNLPG